MNKENGQRRPGMSLLPRNWHWAKLGDVCSPSRQVIEPRSDVASRLPYLGLEDIESGTGRILVQQILKEVQSATFAFDSRHVLYGKLRPYLNKVALPDFDGRCTTELMPLLPVGVDRQYLAWVLRRPETVDAAMRGKTGSRMPRADMEALLASMVPIPPLSEQSRITSLLNEQMAAVEQARTAAEAQLEGCIQFVEASLSASLLCPGTKSLSLKACLTEVTQGVGSRWREYPLLGVSRKGIAPPKEAIGKSPERYKTVDRGTIFYNPMRILLGSIALVDDDDDPGIASPDYVVCRTVEGVLHHRWFYYWLRSSFGEAFIKTLARGAVRERLLFKRLSAAEIVLPPWEVQVKAAERMKDVMLLRRAVQEQIAAINLLPAPLLAKAFSGQLSQRPSFRTRKATTATLAFNTRGAVSSYIVNRLHEQPSFGNIQHQKLLFLTEAHVGLDLGGVYYRDKWGPHEGLEFYRLNGRGRWAEKRDVFHSHKRQGLRGYTYTVGTNIAEQVARAEVTLGDRKPALDALLDLFAPMTTDQAEMYATLFAVWNDFLIAGRMPTDAEIIQDFRENWHERKQKFTPDQLRDALIFMRTNRFIPHGIGPATKIKN